jgi:hypothetical protein
MRTPDATSSAPQARMERHERMFLWIAMIFGVGVSGVAFAYKIAEFIFTVSGDEVKGFADVPVTVYFVVAAGWLSLLVWCFVTGKFVDVERSKYEMLEREAEYERLGE